VIAAENRNEIKEFLILEIKFLNLPNKTAEKKFKKEFQSLIKLQRAC